MKRQSHAFVKFTGMALVLAMAILFLISFRFSHSAKETLRQEGIRYYRMARYEDAVDCFSLALQQKEIFTDRTDEDIYYYLADGEMKQEHYKAAITYYEKLISLGVRSMDLYANLGLCYEQENKDQQAYEYYKKALEQDETNTDLYYYLCETCITQGYLAECAEYAKQGYEYALGQLSRELKEILANGNGEEKLTTGQRQELSKCGRLAYLSGNYEDAYGYYVLLQESGEEHAKLYMGHCLAEQGNYEEALKLFEEYEQTHEKQPLSVAKKAYCYMQLKDYERALPLIEEALAMEGQQLVQELLYEKGVALEMTGDFDGAYDIFAAYVEQYPNDEAAQTEYEFLITRLSDEHAAQLGIDNGNR